MSDDDYEPDYDPDPRTPGGFRIGHRV